MGYVGATSDYVLDETLTGLHAAAGSRVALTFADSLLARVEAEYVLLVEVNAFRRDKALELFRRLSSSIPRLSFTDCTSFAVMRELDVSLAFTADKHFRMAGSGIRPLLVQELGQLVLRLPSS